MSTYNNPKHAASPVWKRPWFAPVAIAAAGLLIGFGIGENAHPRPTTPAPAPTVTVTATPTPAPAVTKTVEVTPEACLTALDLSEQGFTYSAEAMGYMSDALTAAGEFDVAALQKANADLDTLNPKLKALTGPMKTAATECRAAAK